MLIATDDAGCVLSLVAFTYRNCSSILLGSLDAGVALNLGAALDGAGGVFGGVAFTDRYGGGILLFGLDVGVALDLHPLGVRRVHASPRPCLRSLAKCTSSHEKGQYRCAKNFIPHDLSS